MHTGYSGRTFIQREDQEEQDTWAYWDSHGTLIHTTPGA